MVNEEILTNFHGIDARLTAMEKQLNELLAKQSNEKTYYTIPEAAEYCRMKPRTFRNYLKEGYVSGCNPNKMWLFTKNDLTAFVEQFRSKPAKAKQDEINGFTRKRQRGGRV